MSIWNVLQVDAIDQVLEDIRIDDRTSTRHCPNDRRSPTMDDEQEQNDSSEQRREEAEEVAQGRR